MSEKRILFINHIFWPDKINTARLVTELAEGMVEHGWKVTALVTNRPYADHRRKYAQKRETWHGVEIIRAYHPPLSQKKNLTRLITAFILQLVWLRHIPFLGTYDIILIGTNPPFSYFMLPWLKILKPRAKLVMWAHDMYPEAVIANGGALSRLLGKMISPLAGFSLRRLDGLVDIGVCMRKRYSLYRHHAREATLPPWAFVEPEKETAPDLNIRKQLFGDARLTILYTGTFGNAHEYDNFLALARLLRQRKQPVAFCFAGFGSRFDELKKAVNEEDVNISFGGFVDSDEELEKRLLSADIHLVSLKPEWTGISVPSKFFGSMAAGRPVIFSGSPDSVINIWLEKFKAGFPLCHDNIEAVAERLAYFVSHPEAYKEMSHNAFMAYKDNFSRETIINGFNSFFESLVEPAARQKNDTEAH